MDIELDESILLPLQGLLDGDQCLNLAHLGNALSQVKASLPDKSWVGVYLLEKDRLVLGPFQGSPACEAIAFDKGMVGNCFSQGQAIHCPDVSKYPGYICCDPIAKSEICVPIIKQGKIIGVLDIDRPDNHDYQNEVKIYAEIAKILANWL